MIPRLIRCSSNRMRRLLGFSRRPSAPNTVHHELANTSAPNITRNSPNRRMIGVFNAVLSGPSRHPGGGP